MRIDSSTPRITSPASPRSARPVRERSTSDTTTTSAGTAAAPGKGWGDRFERSAPPGQPQRMARLLDKLERLGDRLADGDNVGAKIGKVLTRLESLFARYTRPTSPAPAPVPAPDASAPPAPSDAVSPPPVAPTPPATDPVLIAALPATDPVPTTPTSTVAAAATRTLDLVA